jgi:hypothetical protein
MARIMDFGRRVVEFFQIELGRLPHYLTKKIKARATGPNLQNDALFIFFSFCKKNNFREKPLIKLYKFRGHIHRFGWLTWFADLTSLTFFLIIFVNISVLG